jgi:hypothetical protein
MGKVTLTPAMNPRPVLHNRISPDEVLVMEDATGVEDVLGVTGARVAAA